MHVWRQINTLAVAKNFYTETLAIWLPRVDKRWEFSGVTGMHFPLYEWILALLYKVFGFSHAVHRWFSFLITCIAFFSVYQCFIKFGDIKARIIAIAFLFNPLIFYYGFSALPDILSIAMMFSAIAISLSSREFKTKFFIIVLLASGAMMIKYVYVLYGLLLFFLTPNLNFKERLYQLFPYCIGFFMAICWYQYAQYLTAISNGLVEFIAYPRLIPKSLIYPSLKTVFLTIVPELFFGFPLFVIFIFIIFVSFKNKPAIKNKLFWMITIILVLAYIVAASHNLAQHDYYFLPLLFLPLLLIAKIFPINKYVYFCILCMPIWAVLRIIPPNFLKEKVNFYQQERLLLKAIIPKKTAVICGIDQTGCQLFYMLDVKGFPYYKKNELFEKRQGKGQIYLEEAILRGAKYLISTELSDTSNPYLVKHQEKIIKINENLILVKFK